jgi:hypothetical protein
MRQCTESGPRALAWLSVLAVVLASGACWTARRAVGRHGGRRGHFPDEAPAPGPAAAPVGHRGTAARDELSGLDLPSPGPLLHDHLSRACLSPGRPVRHELADRPARERLPQHLLESFEGI